MDETTKELADGWLHQAQECGREAESFRLMADLDLEARRLTMAPRNEALGQYHQGLADAYLRCALAVLRVDA